VHQRFKANHDTYASCTFFFNLKKTGNKSIQNPSKIHPSRNRQY
jgi:hypothetical protein